MGSSKCVLIFSFLLFVSLFSTSSFAHLELEISSEEIYVGEQSEVILSVRGQDTDVLTTAPVDVVLVIDISTSMLRNMPGTTDINIPASERRMTIAIETAKEFVDMLSDNPENRISVVALNHEANELIGLTPVSQSAQIKSQLDSLVACGGTNFYLSLIKAKNILESSGRANAEKAIVFMTDGVPTTSNMDLSGSACPFSFELVEERTVDGNSMTCSGQYYVDANGNCAGSTSDPTDVAVSLVGADIVKDAGYDIFTIGFGSINEIDMSILRDIASKNEYAKHVGSDFEMLNFYEEISTTLTSVVANDVIVSLNLPNGVLFTGTHFEYADKDISFSSSGNQLSWDIGSLSKAEQVFLHFNVESNQEGIYPIGGSNAYADYLNPLGEITRLNFNPEDLVVIAPAPVITDISFYGGGSCTELLPNFAPIRNRMGCIKVSIEDDNLDLENVYSDLSSISTSGSVKGSCVQKTFASKPFQYECEFRNVNLDIPSGGEYNIPVTATDLSGKSDTQIGTISFEEEDCSLELKFRMMGTPDRIIEITVKDSDGNIYGELTAIRTTGKPKYQELVIPNVPSSTELFLHFHGPGPYPSAGNPLHVYLRNEEVRVFRNLVFNVQKNDYVFSLNELTGYDNLCDYNRECIKSSEDDICDGKDSNCDGYIDSLELADGTILEGGACGECELGDTKPCSMSLHGICGETVRECVNINGIPTWNETCQLIPETQYECPADEKPLIPLFDCIEYDGSTGEYIAHFSYHNENDYTVTVNHGDENVLIPSFEIEQKQPQTFSPGKASSYPASQFQVRFDGDEITWSLTGPDGFQREKSASSNSRWCPGVVQTDSCTPGEKRPCECNCDETVVLLIRDDNHNNEDIEDLDEIYSILTRMGVNVVFKLEEEFSTTGITYDDIKDYDLVWFSNPGWPPNHRGSIEALQKYFEEGNPVILQGDDMTWSMNPAGQTNVFDDLMEEVTGMRFINNGWDIDHVVNFRDLNHPILRELKGTSFTYRRNDIDINTLVGNLNEFTIFAESYSESEDWQNSFGQHAPIPTIVMRDGRYRGAGVLMTSLLTFVSIQPESTRETFIVNMVNYMMNMVEKCHCDLPEAPYCEVAVQTCLPSGKWGTCDVIPELSGQGCINCQCNEDVYHVGEDFSCNVYGFDDEIIEEVFGTAPNTADVHLKSFDVEHLGVSYEGVICPINVKIFDAVSGKCGGNVGEYSFEETSYRNNDDLAFCLNGTIDSIPNFPEPGESVEWTCIGKYGGETAVCEAVRVEEVIPIDASCGPAADSYDYQKTEFFGPFCDKGSLLGSEPTFPGVGSSVEWTCLGKNDGLNVDCVAEVLSPVPAQCEDISLRYGIIAEDDIPPFLGANVVAYYIPQTSGHYGIFDPVPLEFSHESPMPTIQFEFNVRRATDDDDVIMDYPSVVSCSIDEDPDLFSKYYKTPEVSEIVLCNNFHSDPDSCFDVTSLMRSNLLLIEPHVHSESSEFIEEIGSDSVDISCTLEFSTSLDTEDEVLECGNIKQTLSVSAAIDQTPLCDMRYCLIKEELNHPFWMGTAMETVDTIETVFSVASTVCGIVPTVGALLESVGTGINAASIPVAYTVGRTAACRLQDVGTRIESSGNWLMEKVWRNNFVESGPFANFALQRDSGFSLEFLCDLVHCRADLIPGSNEFADNVFNNWLDFGFLTDLANQAGQGTQNLAFGGLELGLHLTSSSCVVNQECKFSEECVDGRCRNRNRPEFESSDLFSSSISERNLLYNMARFCVPKIAENIVAYRQVHCGYVECLMTRETIRECVVRRNDIYCREAYGTLFELLGPARLLRSIKGVAMNAFENLPSTAIQIGWAAVCDSFQDELWSRPDRAAGIEGCTVPEANFPKILLCDVPKAVYDSIDAYNAVRSFTETFISFMRDVFSSESSVIVGDNICTRVQSFESVVDENLVDCDCSPVRGVRFNVVKLETSGAQESYV